VATLKAGPGSDGHYNVEIGAGHFCPAHAENRSWAP